MMLFTIIIIFFEFIHLPVLPEKSIKSTSGDSLKVEVKEIRHIYKSSKDSTVLLRFHFHYPVIKSASGKVVADSLNTAIFSFINSSIIENGEPEAPDTLYKDLVDQYLDLQKRFPKYLLEWNFNRSVDIIYQTHNVVSLRFNEHSFTGGAHPISNSYYDSFSLKNGKKLSLRDIFISNYRKPLTSLAEQVFRKQKGLSQDSSLAAAGYWFKNNSYTLSDNYALTHKGLLVYYNEYEIAPYYMGPTRIIIPFDKLKPLIKPEYLERLTGKK